MFSVNDHQQVLKDEMCNFDYFTTELPTFIYIPKHSLDKL